MLRLAAAVFILISPLAACGEPQNQAEEEGVYGASSGANPNLADIQSRPVPVITTAPDGQAPASPEEATYPSDAARTPPVSSSGRGSAQTGATDGQN